jgi:PAS domain S-box-containing protein
VVALLARPDAVAREQALEAGAVDVWEGLPESVGAMIRLTARQAATHHARRLEDLQALHRAQDELASTRDLLGRLVETLPLPVMAFDSNQRVLLFNPAAEQALGLDAHRARMELRASDLFADQSDPGRLQAALRENPSGMVTGFSTRLRARTGAQLPVRISAAEVFSADGLARAVVHIVEDQRVFVHLEERLATTTTRLIESEERVSGMLALVEEAAALSQPLTAVIGIFDILAEDPEIGMGARGWLDRAGAPLQQMAETVRSIASGRTANRGLRRPTLSDWIDKPMGR